MRLPFTQERLRLRRDGRGALGLKTAWHDGARVYRQSELVRREIYRGVATPQR